MQAPPGAKKSNAPLVVGIVVVLIVGAVVYFMYFKKDDSPSPTPTDDDSGTLSSMHGQSGSDDSGSVVKPKPKLTFTKLTKIGSNGVAYIDCDDVNLYASNNNDVYQMPIPNCS